MVRRILVILVVAWIVLVVAERWMGLTWFAQALALTPARVISDGWLWQLASYMWLHSTSTFTHILFNGIFLWMFGGTLEQQWGSRAFLRFYFFCGLGAGVVVLVSGALFFPQIPVLGASGAIYGLVAAWAITQPNRVVYLFGVFPIKGKHFALIPIVFALADFLVQGQGTSHAAHLGGLATGALLVTGWWKPQKLYRQVRLLWLRRKLKVIDGGGRKTPPSGGYWNFQRPGKLARRFSTKAPMPSF
jgi:membrane associated rhomboid family serine protease